MRATTVKPGEIWDVYVPYNDDPKNGKERPVLVIAVSPMSHDDDRVVLVVPITGFHGGGSARSGDVAILDYRRIPGLTCASWIHARRLWSAHPDALIRKRGELPQDVLDDVMDQVLVLFGAK